MPAAGDPPTRRSGLSRRGWSLLGATFGLVVAGRLLGVVELAVLAVAAGALLVLAALWAGTRRTDVEASRRLHPRRLQVGTDGRVDLTVANRGRRSSPVLGAVDLFDEGRRAVRLLVPPLAPGTEGHAAYRLPTARRGRYRIGPLTLSAGDPFGLVRRVWTAAPAEVVLVHPGSTPSSRPRGPRSGLAGEQRRRARGYDDEEFLTLREYEVGDDLRRVHWRSTARTGDLMIRQHETRGRSRTTVLLDTRAAAHDPGSFERAVEATASVAVAAGRSRRLEVLTSAGTVLAGPIGHVTPVLDHLATVETGDHDGLLPGPGPDHPAGGTLVVVTGRPTPDDGAVLAGLASRTLLLLVTTGAPAPEVAVPGTLRVDASSAPFPDAWNHALSRWRTAASSPPPSPSRA
ncbi:MAG: DUF58 domain-containing protein [Acidimicrobiia bacterium]|nr:DUF58 domain-containing protein [Acidimicrobiia bacterium]